MHDPVERGKRRIGAPLALLPLPPSDRLLGAPSLLPSRFPAQASIEQHFIALFMAPGQFARGKARAIGSYP